jgi:hypothetical protein
MSVALTPPAAIGWLRSLSVQLRAVAVLDAAGAPLAGDPEIARRAAGLLARPGGADTVRDGDLLLVRSARHAVAASLRPGALPGLQAADLRAALDGLDAP